MCGKPFSGDFKKIEKGFLGFLDRRKCCWGSWRNLKAMGVMSALLHTSVFGNSSGTKGFKGGGQDLFFWGLYKA